MDASAPAIASPPRSHCQASAPAGVPATDASSVDPTCATPATAGAPSAAGPGTAASAARSSPSPSPVQTAPAASQLAFGASATVTAASDDGATVISQRRVLAASTCRTPVTVPPVTRSAASRSICALTATSSLNASPSVNAVSPSWLGGSDPKVAVRSSSFRIVPVASASPSTAPDGLASTSRKTSPLSSSVSSRTVTSIVFTVSSGVNTSVPDVAS